jgi:hypothetical protein
MELKPVFEIDPFQFDVRPISDFLPKKTMETPSVNPASKLSNHSVFEIPIACSRDRHHKAGFQVSSSTSYCFRMMECLSSLEVLTTRGAKRYHMPSEEGSSNEQDEELG